MYASEKSISVKQNFKYISSPIALEPIGLQTDLIEIPLKCVLLLYKRHFTGDYADGHYKFERSDTLVTKVARGIHFFAQKVFDQETTQF